MRGSVETSVNGGGGVARDAFVVAAGSAVGSGPGTTSDATSVWPGGSGNAGDSAGCAAAAGELCDTAAEALLAGCWAGRGASGDGLDGGKAGATDGAAGAAARLLVAAAAGEGDGDGDGGASGEKLPDSGVRHW